MEPSAIDLTEVLVALIGSLFVVINTVAVALINAKIRDRQLAQLLENAVQNSLGVLQQVASGTIVKAHPQLRGVVPESLAPGVQYVMDHAAEAVSRFGVSPTAIAEKLVSRIGLREIETNIAVTASPSATVVSPLAPSPPSTTADDLNHAELRRHMEGN